MPDWIRHFNDTPAIASDKDYRAKMRKMMDAVKFVPPPMTTPGPHPPPTIYIGENAPARLIQEGRDLGIRVVRLEGLPDG